MADQSVAVGAGTRPERARLLEIVFGPGGVAGVARFVHDDRRLGAGPVGAATRRSLEQLEQLVLRRPEHGVDDVGHTLLERLLALGARRAR